MKGAKLENDVVDTRLDLQIFELRCYVLPIYRQDNREAFHH